jgi:signal transduction histidine kinase
VLGHRLSLLSVHAGALEYRPGLAPEQVARAAGVIRDNAHQALQDLRDVVGVLRAPVGDSPVPALPQPRAGDLPQLVAESREAGMSVTLSQDTPTGIPDQLGRTVHRIVQEALTNARRHAPGSPVEVSVTGGPGSGLEVSVRNEATSREVSASAPAGSEGRGLLGLSERVALAEGRLRYGPDPDGGWRVAVWLPWRP